MCQAEAAVSTCSITKILDDSNSDNRKSSDLPGSFLGDHLEIYIYGEFEPTVQVDRLCSS